MQYLKIFRPPNLAIIILTQYLIRYCLLNPFYTNSGIFFAISAFNFALLVLATLLIAAGGYIINDILDVESDKINKPDKVWIGKLMTKKRAYILYLTLTIIGVIIGFYLSFYIGYIMFGLIFVAIALLLYFYSTTYQKIAILGNIAISFLSAMVILIVWLYEFFALRSQPVLFAEVMPDLKYISTLVQSYAVFAFLTSIIREIVKDIEDRDGDMKAGYRTLPIVYGVNTSKMIVMILAILTMAALGYGQYVLFQNNLMIVFWYLLIAVQTLFAYLLFLTIKSKNKEDFKSVSDAAKIVMVAGILSMQLFCISL
jgi:4-hydroxybenzoate polyprenyltransferase